MSRPRIPTPILEARGAFKKDPQRKRDGEPIVKDPLGAAPERLIGEALVAWQDIAREAPTGVLTQADRIHVEIMAQLIAEMRADFNGFTGARLGLLNKCLGQTGMTPSARASLSIPEPTDVNPFSEI